MQRPKRRALPFSQLRLENLEDRVTPATAVFQQGVNGYEATQDTALYSVEPDNAFGTEVAISVD